MRGIDVLDSIPPAIAGGRGRETATPLRIAASRRSGRRATARSECPRVVRARTRAHDRDGASAAVAAEAPAVASGELIAHVDTCRDAIEELMVDHRWLLSWLPVVVDTFDCARISRS
jgi:hypothetical protein